MCVGMREIEILFLEEDGSLLMSTGAIVEKFSGGSSTDVVRRTPLIYRACADYALCYSCTLRSDLGYCQNFSHSLNRLGYILSKHAAVKTPRALVMRTHANMIRRRGLRKRVDRFHCSLKRANNNYYYSCIFTLESKIFLEAEPRRKAGARAP